MQIILKPGDNLWSTDGLHVCDDKGMAIVVTEETTVDIADEAYANAWQVIQSWRETRGCNPLTGEPLPAPVEPVTEVIPETPALEGAANG